MKSTHSCHAPDLLSQYLNVIHFTLIGLGRFRDLASSYSNPDTFTTIVMDNPAVVLDVMVKRLRDVYHVPLLLVRHELHRYYVLNVKICKWRYIELGLGHGVYEGKNHSKK